MNIYMFVTWVLSSIKKLGNSSVRHDSLIFAPSKDEGSIHNLLTRRHIKRLTDVHI